ncbi:hypothetical protein V8C86DRAFT_619651 [Haematococcus lacustris]
MTYPKKACSPTKQTCLHGITDAGCQCKEGSNDVCRQHHKPSWCAGHGAGRCAASQTVNDIPPLATMQTLLPIAALHIKCSTAATAAPLLLPCYTLFAAVQCLSVPLIAPQRVSPSSQRPSPPPILTWPSPNSWVLATVIYHSIQHMSYLIGHLCNSEARRMGLHHLPHWPSVQQICVDLQPVVQGAPDAKVHSLQTTHKQARWQAATHGFVRHSSTRTVCERHRTGTVAGTGQQPASRFLGLG